MHSKTTLLCVLKLGKHYDPSWVYALRRALNRVAGESIGFRCLTDCDAITPALGGAPLRDPSLTSYWSLINWFAPDQFADDERVIAVGLDTLLIGDLSDLANYDGRPAGIRDFFRPNVLASGVMTWRGNELSHIYDAFQRDPDGIRKRYNRMDPWLRSQFVIPTYLQDHYPNQIFSYKAHARKGPPEGARIVCFHGRPAITETPLGGWARREWNRL